MDFFYGMFCGACFFVCLFLAYRIGKKETSKPMELDPIDFELDDEALRIKAKKQRKAFEDMMAYDMTKAMKGGKRDESDD